VSRILFYDTETTGTDFKRHSIIQIAGILEIDGVEVDRFTFNVRPHEKAAIEDAALTANGHKREDLPGYPEMKTVLKGIKYFLGKYVDPFDKTDKLHLAGYNNRGFDDNFFRMFFTLCGDNFFGAYFWPDTIDVLSLASHHLIEARDTMPSFKLHRVAKTLGVEVDDSLLHTALCDVELTIAIYKKVAPTSLY